MELARLALPAHSLIGEGELADQLIATLVNRDPEHLGDLRHARLSRKRLAARFVRPGPRSVL